MGSFSLPSEKFHWIPPEYSVFGFKEVFTILAGSDLSAILGSNFGVILCSNSKVIPTE